MWPLGDLLKRWISQDKNASRSDGGYELALLFYSFENNEECRRLHLGNKDLRTEYAKRDMRYVNRWKMRQRFRMRELRPQRWSSLMKLRDASDKVKLPRRQPQVWGSLRF